MIVPSAELYGQECPPIALDPSDLATRACLLSQLRWKASAALGVISRVHPMPRLLRSGVE